MKIAFVDLWDPHDPHNWSGIPSRMVEHLSAYSEVETIGPLVEPIRHLFWAHKVAYRLNGARFDEQRTPVSLRHFARRITRSLRNRSVDAVLSPGSIAISYVKLGIPIVIWTDACFDAMGGYYHDFTRLCRASRRQGSAQERAALDNCRLALYASNWAADTARTHYPEHAHKIRVVPFGANLDPAYDLTQVQRLLDAKTEGVCNLLFVGINWARKGGEIALEATRLLNLRGIAAKLSIVGCKPFEPGRAPPYAEVVGFLSRGDAQQRERLAELFRTSHFFIFPTLAEAFGIVLSEAAAFGLPAITCDTGGLGDVVVDGVTGRRLRSNATAVEYADAIEALLRDKAGYRRMSVAAFERYRSCLNWRTNCGEVARLISDVSGAQLH